MAMEISRRSFLKGAAATGVVAALSSIGISAAAEEAAAADESVKSYLPQEKYDIAEERDFDVVVVGAGGGGMSAAIRAAQLGLSTVLLEQRSVTGGTTLFTEGLFAVNSHIQKENGKNPPDLGYDLFTTAMDYHHWYADGALFRRYMDKSGENIAWLESVGVEFQGTGTMCDNVYNTWHQYKYEEGQISGRTYVDNLTKAVTEAGATLVLGSEGVNIIQAEDGFLALILAPAETGAYVKAGPGDRTDVRFQEVSIVQGGLAFGRLVDLLGGSADSHADFREHIEADFLEFLVGLMVLGRLDGQVFNLRQAVTGGFFLGESPGCGQRQAGEKDQCVFHVHIHYRSMLMMSDIRAAVEKPWGRSSVTRRRGMSFLSSLDISFSRNFFFSG